MRHVREFSTFQDFIEAVEHGTTDMPHSSRQSLSLSESFTQTENMDHCVRLMRLGWREGVDKALERSEQIERKLYETIERPTIQYDVTGEMLDVGRYCQGEPEHWGNWQTESIQKGQSTRYVHLVVNAAVSAGVSTDVIIGRGCAIASLINVLEMMGTRVKVTAVTAGKGHEQGYIEVRMPMKNYDEPLDIDRLVFVTAHPSMFRRATFAVYEQAPKALRALVGIPDNYAGQYYTTPHDTDGDKGDLYFGRMMFAESAWKTVESSVQWVKDKLRELGLTV